MQRWISHEIRDSRGRGSRWNGILLIALELAHVLFLLKHVINDNIYSSNEHIIALFLCDLYPKAPLALDRLVTAAGKLFLDPRQRIFWQSIDAYLSFLRQ